MGRALPKSDLTARVMQQLAVRYAPPRYGFFEQVHDSVGFGTRRADAVAVAMWRSLGLEVIGFEVKAWRADWLNERKRPEKADAVGQYCDRWFLVLASDDVAKDEEIPEPWGVLVFNGTGLRQRRNAGKLNPKELDRWFVAEMLRHAHRQGEILTDARIRVIRDEGFEDGKKSVTDRDFALQKSAELKEAVDAFEKASGVEIRTYNGKELGRAVRLVMANQQERITQEIEYGIKALERAANHAKMELKDFREKIGVTESADQKT